jgi:thiol-disulfide isomerase/thioredoxin
MTRKIVYFLAFTALLWAFPVHADAEDTVSSDTARAFAEAGLPLLRQKAVPPDFSLPLAAPEGLAKIQNLGDLKGKVVFLNFWATWCGPCRSEMPSMEALYRRFNDKGLEMLAVNCGENSPEVTAFMRSNKLSFPTALDRKGEVSGLYGIQAIPTTYLIDRDGKIILRMVGSLNWNTPKIQAAFESLLK